MASTVQVERGQFGLVETWILENGVVFTNPATIRPAPSYLTRGSQTRGFNREHERAQLAQILDLLAEDSWRNVYARASGVGQCSNWRNFAFI
jgi:hypothetical protein